MLKEQKVVLLQAEPSTSAIPGLFQILARFRDPRIWTRSARASKMR